MKLVLVLLLAALPVSAESQVASVPMELSVRDFDKDAADVWSKVKDMLRETKLKSHFRKFNGAIAKHDAEEAQKILDTISTEYPELQKQEPLAFEVRQGEVDFWKQDFPKAYAVFDHAVKAMEEKYPKGIPPQSKYAKQNTGFLADLYFDRASTRLQMREYEKAIEDMDKAIALLPRSYMYVNKCRAWLRIGQRKEAAAAYEEAYKLNSDWVLKTPDLVSNCAMMAERGFNPKPCQIQAEGKKWGK